MKKLMIGLTALAAMGGLALAPTAASARAGGWHGHAGAMHGSFQGFHGGHGFAGGHWRGHRGFGVGAAALGLGLGLAAAGAYPYYGYPAYYGADCYLTRHWTPYGYRLVRVCD